MKIASGVKTIRLLIKDGNRLKRACTISLTKKDASIYLIPHATSGMYFYGQRFFDGQETQDSFNYTGQLSSSKAPKLSIHQTGQVHIYSLGHKKAGPLNIPPLFEWRGQHLATVCPDTLAAFPSIQEHRNCQEAL